MDTTNSKRKRIIIIAVVASVAAAALMLALILSSGGKARELSRQLDLGKRYLDELDYDNALIAFNRAIEIDPKCEDAYIGVADAYIGKGETDSAQKILEEGLRQIPESLLIKDKLKEIYEKGVNAKAIDKNSTSNSSSISSSSVTSANKALTEKERSLEEFRKNWKSIYIERIQSNYYKRDYEMVFENIKDFDNALNYELNYCLIPSSDENIPALASICNLDGKAGGAGVGLIVGTLGTYGIIDDIEMYETNSGTICFHSRGTSYNEEDDEYHLYNSPELTYIHKKGSDESVWDWKIDFISLCSKVVFNNGETRYYISTQKGANSEDYDRYVSENIGESKLCEWYSSEDILNIIKSY